MRVNAILQSGLKVDRATVTGYAQLLGGSVGRLVISLVYFISVANTLSVGDFGLFATASAVGITLSRIGAFGFVSPLYRISTRKPHLVGTYTAGLLAAFAASLPFVALVALVLFLLFFEGQMAPVAFAAIIVAEVALWRALEVVCIVNNGLHRFGRGAVTVILGSAVRALAAFGFALSSDGSLLTWSLVYLAANAVATVLAIALFYPRVRLRFVPRVYLARWRDSVTVAAAEVSFYVQSDLDKLLVLALAGAQTAGLYAILMRLVDLTALPVRSFNTMVVQRLMRKPGWLSSWKKRWGLEAAIAAVSIGGLGFLGTVLHFFPTALGRNVADIAPLVLLALLVPAFRNVIEYQSDLLYARGRTGVRVLILLMLGVMKAGFLSLLLTNDFGASHWVVGLNGVFAVLWLASMTTTYIALDGRPLAAPRFRRSRQLPG
ncbi:lipopolysaccharide biosynthesis protein [Aureimonas mangrovi]|uniref:lipopolysaccharide biosynthesis protein n=1 Tax=Aureimonas mangrovi TaxID=2758041 RepID=UPI00163D5B16|nr:lipopolysaccharide biosynthesis protein [Aureimonas mangrovi]